ncbi:MAG: DMT family transporter [Candidatus Marinimicrobia bacterium]|nr:DMT family transporter [Candidatus Neomarinimicrobiota bacterium]
MIEVLSSKIKEKKHIILYIILCIIWSTTWSAIKIGLEQTPPSVGIALRFSIGSIVLFIYILVTNRKIHLNLKYLFFYFLVGMFNAGFSYYLTYKGMENIPSSLSSILWTALPLVVGILSHFFVKGERLNLIKIISILVASVGVINILSDNKLIFNQEVLLGGITTLLAVLCGAISGVIAKRWRKPYDPIALTAFSLGFGAIFHLIISTVFNSWSNFTPGPISIGSILYLGIFGSAIVFTIYYYLLQRLTLVKLAFITFITPITASLIGWGFLNEPITARELIGVIIIFSGLLLYDWKKYFHFLKKRLNKNNG